MVKKVPGSQWHQGRRREADQGSLAVPAVTRVAMFLVALHIGAPWEVLSVSNFPLFIPAEELVRCWPGK